jgi:hypothetical protein
MTESTEDIATNPGVNGLAQFGRNALERIAQLERELAEARALIAAGDAAREQLLTWNAGDKPPQVGLDQPVLPN